MVDIKYIINNIVYCDKLLSLRDLGSDYKITSIANVDKFSVEECVKTIRESNHQAKFNTVQYSESDQTIYFYTDIKLSTQAWEDRRCVASNQLTSNSEISKQVNEILASETSQDNNWVSLYDVATLIKKVADDYNKMKEQYYYFYSTMNRMLDSKWKFTMVKLYGFDYDHNELIIRVNYIGNIFDEIKFAKQDGEFFITQSATYNGYNEDEQYVIKSKPSLYDEELLTSLGPELTNVYDQFLNYKDFFKQHIYSIKAKNAKFLVDISDGGVSIEENSSENNFRLSYLNVNNNYKYDGNPSLDLSSLQGNEEELFKKIFVDINDCPEWSKATIYEIRQSQLLEQQRKEQIESKKQKRLELVRKWFPIVVEFLDNLN